MTVDAVNVCMDGLRRLQLTPYFQEKHSHNDGVGFRFRVEANIGCLIDEEIFRYYQKPLNATTGEADSVLSGICSIPDMDNLSIGQPVDESTPVQFRLSYMDIVVESPAVAIGLWQLIQDEVDTLIDAMDRETVLEDSEPVWAGAPL